MEKSEIDKILSEITNKKNIKTNEPMSRHTSFKIGGPADFLVTPENRGELARLVKVLKEKDIPSFIMGNGSNLLVTEKGIRGVVIKIFDNFRDIKVEGDHITAEGGALLSKIAKTALENSLEGFEFASGIPGTLGGAIVMNAGAYGGEMKDVSVMTEYMDSDGNISMLEGEAQGFGYRTSAIPKGSIVLSARLKLEKGEYSKIKAFMDDLNSRRKEKQPLTMPSAGSVFKRPEGYFAGKLIEDCGLKGTKIGGAQISEKHCGFIVNKENACSADVLDLIEICRKKVFEKFGVELETEVKIIGER